MNLSAHVEGGRTEPQPQVQRQVDTWSEFETEIPEDFLNQMPDTYYPHDREVHEAEEIERMASEEAGDYNIPPA